jgi:hypothetical protein
VFCVLQSEPLWHLKLVVRRCVLLCVVVGCCRYHSIAHQASARPLTRWVIVFLFLARLAWHAFFLLVLHRLASPILIVGYWSICALVELVSVMPSIAICVWHYLSITHSITSKLCAMSSLFYVHEKLAFRYLIQTSIET